MSTANEQGVRTNLGEEDVSHHGALKATATRLDA